MSNTDNNLNKKKDQKIYGKIISVPGEKTVVIEVDLVKKHPKYHKRYRVKKRYMAHANRLYKVGDKVTVIPSKAHSRRKRFETED